MSAGVYGEPPQRPPQRFLPSFQDSADLGQVTPLILWFPSFKMRSRGQVVAKGLSTPYILWAFSLVKMENLLSGAWVMNVGGECSEEWAVQTPEDPGSWTLQWRKLRYLGWK